MSIRKLFNFLIVCFVCLGTAAYAQLPDTMAAPKIKYWKIYGSGSLQFNQISLSNWAAGGTNSVSLVGNITLGANYNRKKSRWENLLQFDYGLLKNEGLPFRKNLDVLNFSTNYSYQLHNDFRLSAFTTLLSQIAPGYNYANDSNGIDYISNFFAPAFIQQGIGLEYTRDSVAFSVILSPLAVKHTLILDNGVDPVTYGVLTGNSRHEFGAFMKANIRRELIRNIIFSSELTLFSNYLEKPQNVDIIYLGKLDIVANKYITMSFTINMIYDDDILLPVYGDPNGTGVEEQIGSRPALQVRQTFGAGLSYKF